MAIKLEASSSPNQTFKIDSLDYTKGRYELFYRDKNETNVKIGLRSIKDSEILVSPAIYSDWVDSTDTPYASTALLLTAITTIAYDSSEEKLGSIVANTGGDGTTSTIVNKFGENYDVDIAADEIVASFGGAFDPLVNIMTTSQTFTVTYNNATDGSTATGARMLQVDYLDENFEAQIGFHVLGSTGSEVTSFSGVGINRAVVVQFGGLSSNVNDIDLTATTDTTIQARIPALESVTQQCIYHTPINRTLVVDFLHINVVKVSGGGAEPVVNLKMYSFSRITLGAYKIMDSDIDTTHSNNLVLNLPEGITFTGREVLYLIASTDKDNTKVFVRFSGVETDS